MLSVTFAWVLIHYYFKAAAPLVIKLLPEYIYQFCAMSVPKLGLISQSELEAKLSLLNFLKVHPTKRYRKN